MLAVRSSENLVLMYGVDDGARTHDDRNHNPGLYQLSYVHHNSFICWRLFGTPGRIRTCYPRLRRPMLYPSELQAQNFKPETYILISTGNQTDETKNGRGREIRTPDILLPKQARDQTALYPDTPDPHESRGGEYYALLKRWSRHATDYLQLVVTVFRMRKSGPLRITDY